MKSNGLSFFVLEAAVVVLALVGSLAIGPVRGAWIARFRRAFLRVAARQGLSVLLVALAAVIARLSILPLVPIPAPFVHDEFSYLLAADTFASGRLTNPTHPMWVHFETFHVDQQPTYMSMYFPGQGVVLAAGKVLFGHPWFGVAIATALMCAAICWMLQGWLPPGWALLGGLLAVMRLGLFSYWVNSYYGGALAALGAALVLGALPRLMRRPEVGMSVILGVGFAVLANSRPYEGFLLAIPVSLALAKWLYGSTRPRIRKAVLRVVLPLSIVAAMVAGSLAYYDWSVFGDPLTLPYKTNRATYAVSPVFLWNTIAKEPMYRHPVMRDFYLTVELPVFEAAKTVPGFLRSVAKKLGIILFFFYGVVLIIPLVMIPKVLRDRRMRFLMLTGAVLLLGSLANAFVMPHYFAPMTCILYALLLQCMRHLRTVRVAGQPLGSTLVTVIPVLCVLLCGIRLAGQPLGLTFERSPAMWYGTESLGLSRAAVEARLDAEPGRQLAIVRYPRNHSPIDDWVYNAADIDSAKVVWAREMSPQRDEELCDYFKDRQVWLIEPDTIPVRVSTYPCKQAVLQAVRGNPDDTIDTK
jgi:hypothetical protein